MGEDYPEYGEEIGPAEVPEADPYNSDVFAEPGQARHDPDMDLIEQLNPVETKEDEKIGKSQCKKICHGFRAIKPPRRGRYSSGQVRCMICDIFISREGCADKSGNTATPEAMGLFCKCCGYRVRTKPRASIYKQKFNRDTQ